MDASVFAACMNTLLEQEEQKLAAAPKQDHPFWPKVRVVAKGAAGLGLGTFMGFAAAEGMNELHKKVMGGPIPGKALAVALPLVGAAAGLAYSQFKRLEEEEVGNAGKPSRPIP